MRVTKEDFTALQTACFETLRVHNLHPFLVTTVNAWQCFHKACSEGRIDLNDWYRKYNDIQTETALRKVFKS